MHENAFDELPDGKKNLRVHLVDDQTPEPWRTRQEYSDDRRAAAAAGERQKEAHQALLRQVKTQTCQMWIAFFAVLVASGTLFVQTLRLQHEVSPQSTPTTATVPRPAPTAAAATPEYGARPTDACRQAIQAHYRGMFGPNLAFQFEEPTQASIDDPERPGQKIHGWLFEARWNFAPPARSTFPMAGRFLARSNTIVLTAPIAGPFERWDARVARDAGKKP